jgi:tetratricopeptide (TPR) repeat protein
MSKQPALCGLLFFGHIARTNMADATRSLTPRQALEHPERGIPLWSGHPAFLAAMILWIAVLAGCSTRGGFHQITDPPDSPVASAAETERRVEGFARFAAGVTHDLNDAPAAALEEYEKAARLDPENASLLFDVSQRYLQLGQSAKAMEILAKSAQSPDASAEALGLYGRAALIAGLTNQAITSCEASLRKDPLRLDTYQTLAEVYFRLGQNTNSLRVIQLAADQAAQADAFFLVGTAELYAKYLTLDPAKADEIKPRLRALLDGAMAQSPENTLLLSQIAGQYAAVGDVSKAMGVYEAMVGGLTDLPLLRDAALEKLANYYLGNGEFDKAEGHLEAIVRDNPTQFPQAYYFLGSIAAKNGHYEKAEDYLKRFLVLNGNFEPAYYELARAQVALDHGEGALETLKKAKTRFSATFLGEFLSALAYSRVDDPTNAVNQMTSAEIIARSSNPSRLTAGFYFQLGAMQEKAKSIQDSERSFRRALELAPDSAETLNYLGYMWAARGENLDEAHAMIEKALRQEPDNPAYLDSLAWVLFKLGRHADALPPIRRSVELSDKPDPVLYDHLGDILGALGQQDEARAAWEKSLAAKPDDGVRKKLDALPASAAKTP